MYIDDDDGDDDDDDDDNGDDDDDDDDDNNNNNNNTKTLVRTCTKLSSNKSRRHGDYTAESASAN